MESLQSSGEGESIALELGPGEAAVWIRSAAVDGLALGKGLTGGVVDKYEALIIDSGDAMLPRREGALGLEGVAEEPVEDLSRPKIGRRTGVGRRWAGFAT